MLTVYLNMWKELKKSYLKKKHPLLRPWCKCISQTQITTVSTARKVGHHAGTRLHNKIITGPKTVN